MLETGDKVQFGTSDWYPVVGENPARYKGVGEYVIPPANVTNVRYLFRVGDHLQYENGWAFIIESEEQANIHIARQEAGEKVRRVATGDQFVLSNANIGEVRIPKSGTVTIPDDIFHVEKRLRTGVRDVGGLTVTVSPNPEQTAAMVEFNRPNGKYLNAVELREIASLLNEIADCL